MSSNSSLPPAIGPISQRSTCSEDTPASSAQDVNRNLVTITAAIRRRPKKMKTQIAKLVYDPVTKTIRNAVNENESPTGELEDFQKKRDDRNKEIKEIQEMLNEITNTPTKENKPQEGGLVSASSQTQTPKRAAQRSKTEINLRPPTIRRSVQRTGAQTTRSKSVQSSGKENASPKPRQKPYSPEEARRYMQEQKKKRKSLVNLADPKPTINKNEIKKRLEDLRKNTRQIVNKNVKMAKKKAISPAKKEDQLKAPSEISRVLVSEPRTEREQRSIVFSEKSLNPSHRSETHKKIGLLRKPEVKDHSFSAIKDLNMDKENLILEILTPELTNMLVPKSKAIASVEPSNTDVVISEHKEKIVDEQPKKPESSLKRSKIVDLSLEVPQAKLKHRVSLRDKSVQVDKPVHDIQKPQKEVPYWLKPTAVQAYPYNFIMAVRKKLEAITNSPAVAPSTDRRSTSKIAETPLNHPNSTRTNNVKRKILDNQSDTDSKSPEHSAPTKANHTEQLQHSRTLSEITSNFSSISIQLPESNTKKSETQKPIAEVQKSVRHDEDDTTVSSSVFSSPEKKKIPREQSQILPQSEADGNPLSPLSIENISNLHIKSKSMIKNVTVDRGDDFPTEIARPKIDSGAVSSRSDVSVDFNQLLDDFNRSLSQVIEVNHQLKTTLVKSHQLFSPEKRKIQSTVERANIPLASAKSLELADYVSDFEESSNTEDRQTKGLNTTRSSISIPEVETTSGKSSSQQASSSSSSAEEVIEEESTAQSSSEEVKSKNTSRPSIDIQTFVVPPTKDHTYDPQIHEDEVQESPKKDNLSMNQYSRDSLEVSSHEEYIKTHVNTTRGDFDDEKFERSNGAPPSYKTTTYDTANIKESNVMNSSFESSELLQVINKSDFEISILSLNRSHSESTVNYSSIGLYEKLIQNEASKSEHLAALLKMREKALIDRTKGQIAWLEVQKERYKSKGLTVQISAVKKKQRGILLKMEKEREEIKKLLQQARIQRDNKLRIPEIRPSSDVPFLHPNKSGIHKSAVLQTTSLHKRYHHHQQQQQQRHQEHHSSRSKSSTIVKGYELETSRSLEQLLLKREEDLRRRREHVERLMEWHRRLDQEEAEVLHLERMLLDYNNAHVQPQDSSAEQDTTNPNQTKIEKKLRDINRSLRELNSISGVEGGSTDAGAGDADTVRTTGSKLNKLWRRLTSQRIEKFEPNKKYKLCKSDLEQLYEEAKLAVLHEFGGNAGQLEVLLGQSSISTPQPSTLADDLPQLNLNFSSGPSDTEMVRGNYNPSAAEEEFLGFAIPAVSLKDVPSEESERDGVSMSKGKTGSSSSSFGLPSFADSDRVSIHSPGSKFIEELCQSATFSRRDSNLKADFDGKQSSSASDSELSGIKTIEQHFSDAKTASSRTSVIASASHSGKTQSHSHVVTHKSSDPEDPVTSGASKSSLRTDKEQNEDLQSTSNGNASTETNTSIDSIESAAKSNETPSLQSLSKSVESSNAMEASHTSHLSGPIISSGQNDRPQITETPSVEEEISSKAVGFGSVKPSEISNSKTVPRIPLNSMIHDADSESEVISAVDTACEATDVAISSGSIHESLTLDNEIKSATIWSARFLPALDSHPDVDLDPPIVSLSTIGIIEEPASTEIPSENTPSESIQHTGDEGSNSALTSIKSTDHSTNSKHSITQSNHPTFTEYETLNGVTENEDTAQTYSSAFDCSAAANSTSISSNQIRSSVIMSVSQPPGIEGNPEIESESNAFYESDFTESEETNIDDLSMPKFEITGEDEQLNESQTSTTDLEKRLIDLDVSLKDLDATFERALSPEKTFARDEAKGTQQQIKTASNDNTLMPDIINEVELRRRQQAIVESEMMQFEHAVPYMYMREIPNKPPPPYVPPAHGSPMTTIFPSEERIKDITYRRTKELYHEILNIDTADEHGKKPPSVLDENITNIYERIILDICKEYLTEYEAVLTAADPNNFHSPLAFFNPPDRLKCMQDFIYKEVRKSLAMDKNSPKRNQAYSVYGHRGKRDHIGEIIIQEMYDEDDKWSNFYEEESEVLELIIDEMIGGVVRDIATQALDDEVAHTVEIEVAEVPCIGST